MLGLVKYCEDLFNEEYSTIETPISFTAERVEVPAGQVPEEIQDNLIDAIFACQNGVTRIIPTVPDTVETSSFSAGMVTTACASRGMALRILPPSQLARRAS